MASLTVNPDYKLIGNNIKQMRTKSQVSQQSLAKAINISQTHMSNLENGKTGVSLAIAIRISQHLKCSLDELIFGTNKKSYPAASKPLSDHTVDEFNQLLKRSLAEMMFQCLQHPEVQNVKSIELLFSSILKAAASLWTQRFLYAKTPPLWRG